LSMIAFNKSLDPLALHVMDIVVERILLTGLKVYSIVILS